MKKFIITSFVLASLLAHAQEGKVGVNNHSPKATLHINKGQGTTTNEGIIIPKLTKERTSQIDDANLEKGTLIFIDDPSVATFVTGNPKVQYIDVEGFYYYDGEFWRKVSPNQNSNNFENIYTKDGIINQSDPKRIVDLGQKNLIFKREANGGKIGIGNENPEAELHVAGKMQANGLLYDSDARLKKDIKNIEESRISELRAVTYFWNEKGKEFGGDTKLQYGFIAQEIEKVYPELVNTDSRGYKSVNYVAIVPLLVKALQEQNKEIQDLKKEVKQLQKNKK